MKTRHNANTNRTRTRTRRLTAFVLAVALAGLSTVPIACGMREAQEPVESAAASQLLTSVVAIGASVTFGFGNGVDLDGSLVLTNFGQTLEATAPQAMTLYHDADLGFFIRPGPAGEALVTKALSHNPTLVIGIDFLFWYGYGNRNLDGTPIRSADDRLTRLEAGLAQLDRFTCPIVVADFPDMTPAIGMMLSRAQVPDLQTHERLSARVRQWAAERGDVLVVELAELVGKLQSGTVIHAGGLDWPETPQKPLLQHDRLHPTVDGTIVTSLVVWEVLAGAGLIDTPKPAADFESIRARLREVIREAKVRAGEGAKAA